MQWQKGSKLKGVLYDVLMIQQTVIVFIDKVKAGTKGITAFYWSKNGVLSIHRRTLKQR